MTYVDVKAPSADKDWSSLGKMRQSAEIIRMNLGLVMISIDLMVIWVVTAWI